MAQDKAQQNDKGQTKFELFQIFILSLVIAYLNKQLNQMPMIKSDNRLNEGYIPIPTQSTGLSAR